MLNSGLILIMVSMATSVSADSTRPSVDMGEVSVAHRHPRSEVDSEMSLPVEMIGAVTLLHHHTSRSLRGHGHAEKSKVEAATTAIRDRRAAARWQAVIPATDVPHAESAESLARGVVTDRQEQ
mmetsp:Transcript_35721/g.63142  ORF Transcript_35721/g.63142 Transcript_35721/m.63142 type:complete len:124 (-) Transcript_35721:160-531(-)